MPEKQHFIADGWDETPTRSIHAKSRSKVAAMFATHSLGLTESTGLTENKSHHARPLLNTIRLLRPDVRPEQNVDPVVPAILQPYAGTTLRASLAVA